MSGYGYGYGSEGAQAGGANVPGWNGYSYGSPGGGAGFLGGAGGGGFSSSQDSPGSKRSGLANQTLRPVTIKQLVNASQLHPDAPFKIDDVDITQITFVGIIRRVNEQATSIAYEVEDGTGAIEVRVWVESDEGNTEVAAQRKAECGVETWVRVIGQLRSFQNKRNVMGYSIRPVKDFNEVTFHLLESIYVHLWTTKGPPAPPNDASGGPAMGYGQYGGGGGMAHGGSGMATGGYAMQSNPSGPGYGYGGAGGSFGGQADYSGFGGDFSPIQRQVLQCVRQAGHLNEGIHVNQVARQLGPQFGQTAVQRAIEWLISEGHLYSTIDEDHVKCCADS